MFKNLLVLLVTLTFSAVIAQEADPHSGAHVGRKAKVHHHKKGIDKSKIVPVNKASLEAMKKFSTRFNKKGQSLTFNLVPKSKQELNHEHVRNVEPAQISMASLESVSTKAMNKVILQSRLYSGDSCDESSLSEATGTIANSCLPEEDDDNTSIQATTLSALKVTSGGVEYGTMIQSYYVDNYCTQMLSNTTDITGSLMLDHCYSATLDSTAFSYKIMASNSLPSEADGFLFTEYQGRRACNTEDFNGIKTYTFIADGACFTNEDDSSYAFVCSGGSPYVNYYSDSSCSSSLTASYKADDYNCDSSRFRYACISTTAI
jgi:hypothetical protein